MLAFCIIAAYWATCCLFGGFYSDLNLLLTELGLSADVGELTGYCLPFVLSEFPLTISG